MSVLGQACRTWSSSPQGHLSITHHPQRSVAQCCVALACVGCFIKRCYPLFWGIPISSFISALNGFMMCFCTWAQFSLWLSVCFVHRFNSRFCICANFYFPVNVVYFLEYSRIPLQLLPTPLLGTTLLLGATPFAFICTFLLARGVRRLCFAHPLLHTLGWTTPQKTFLLLTQNTGFSFKEQWPAMVGVEPGFQPGSCRLLHYHIACERTAASKWAIAFHWTAALLCTSLAAALAMAHFQSAVTHVYSVLVIVPSSGSRSQSEATDNSLLCCWHSCGACDSPYFLF